MSPNWIEPVLYNLLCALIGFFIGNRLAIGRDKRREFNSLIDPIRHNLLRMKTFPESNLKGTWEIDIMMIRERLPFWKRKAFDRAIKNYKKSKSEKNMARDSLGGFFIKMKLLLFML